MTSSIRVAIVDDHPLILHGLEQTLGGHESFTIVATGGSAADAEAIAARERPDILLLDVSMPGGGIEAAGRIAKAHPEVRIVMLTVSERDDHLKAALEMGASGYIVKGVTGPELRDAILGVSRGQSYITPDLATRVLMRQSRPPSALRSGFGTPPVSPREAEVAGYLLEGKSNRQIAEAIGVSEKTVKRVVSLLMKSFGASSRLEVVAMINRSRPVDGMSPGKS